MERFSEDLNISMTEVHRLLEHWGLKGWREYLVVRAAGKPESFIVLAHPSDKSDFADQLIQLHKDDAIGITASQEVGRWQEAIRNLLIKLSGASPDDIDGSGCDSGDPLDLTLTEISQAFVHLENERAPAKDFKSLLARFKFTDELGHPLENCVEYQELLAAAGVSNEQKG